MSNRFGELVAQEYVRQMLERGITQRHGVQGYVPRYLATFHLDNARAMQGLARLWGNFSRCDPWPETLQRVLTRMHEESTP